jgi:hypothetical protein
MKRLLEAGILKQEKCDTEKVEILEEVKATQEKQKFCERCKNLRNVESFNKTKQIFVRKGPKGEWRSEEQLGLSDESQVTGFG